MKCGFCKIKVLVNIFILVIIIWYMIIVENKKKCVDGFVMCWEGKKMININEVV